MKNTHSVLVALAAGAWLPALHADQPPAPAAQPPATPAAPAPAPAPPQEQTAIQAPSAGLPILFDIRQAETVKLRDVRVQIAFLQHEARYSIACTLEDIRTKGKAHPIDIAVPIWYNPAANERKLPFAQAVTGISVSKNDLKQKFVLAEGKHPQHGTPAFRDFDDTRHWIQASMKTDPGLQVVNFTFTLPYSSGSRIKEPATGAVEIPAPGLSFHLPYLSAWAGEPLRSGSATFIHSEIYPQDVDIKLDNLERAENGTATWDFVKHPLPADRQNTFDIFVGQPCIVTGDTCTWKNGAKYHLSTDYDITASSTLPKDIMGNECSAENLKTPGSGLWAENTPGDGEGEYLLIKPKNPRRTQGILIQTGVTPSVQSTVDPTARTHPATTYSMYTRPRSILVDINNGEDTYTVTLSDDWNPQTITLLDKGKPVNSIKLTLQETYPGTTDSSCYIQSIQLIDPVSK